MRTEPDVHQQGHGQSVLYTGNLPYTTSGAPNLRFGREMPDTIIPRLDIMDAGSSIIYIYDLCGADKNQINLEVSASEVALAAPMATPTKYPDVGYLYQERPKGIYTRLVRPPDNVDLDNLRADFENGILTLTFPKKALKA